MGRERERELVVVSRKFEERERERGFTERKKAMSTRVIIIGGGLAGLSAAHTVIENGGKVTLVDKMAFLGGNSTKATSGISGTLTKAQVNQNVHDSPMVFEKDILKAACGLTHDSPPEHTIPLAHVLAYGSGPAVDWLMERFELDLSKLALMGGHSFPRTHRGKEKFPGFTITYTLMEALEEIEEKTKGEKARIIAKACAKDLIKDASGKVVGLEYVKGGKTEKLFGPVIIATGGFGADFDPDSILVRVRPDIQHLSTTNGDHCTGDGIKMAQKVSGATVDIDRVQVHPTGLVHPKEPNAKVKFLAAEALRGVGGILIDAKGNRFCNELGTRDYVTDCMNKGHGPFRLILNSKASKEIEWHCKHYEGRGVMKPFSSGSELCQEMGISASKLSDTFNKYNADAGKGHPDGYGKKFFPNVPYNVNDSFNVAIVTPVIHYCMGGLKIDTDARVQTEAGANIPGLYAAGEVAGGVHGRNRLGGNSLLDCVVFGRVAGKTAARDLFDLALQTLEKGGSFQADSAKTNMSAKSAPAPGGAPGSSVISAEQVSQHNKADDCWVTLNGKVYDVTSFLPDHPGGRKAILVYAGKDASEEFNMLHAPNVLTKYLSPETCIGTLGESSKM